MYGALTSLLLGALTGRPLFDDTQRHRDVFHQFPR